MPHGISCQNFAPCFLANAGQIKYTQNATGARLYYAYDLAGRVTHQWGSAGYPIRYVYNPQGQLTEMHTYRGGSGWDSDTLPTAFASAPSSLTRWEYHPNSTQLYRKHDADSKFTEYTYTEAGQVKTRKWARQVAGQPLVTTYSYDAAGRQTGIDYSDSTPDVTIGYDRAGRRTRLVDAAGTHAFTYSQASSGQLEQETVTGGAGAVWAGLQQQFGYDNRARRESRSTRLGGQFLPNVNYDYDNAGRLESITTSGEPGKPVKVGYHYVANSGSRLDHVSYHHGNTLAMTGVRTLDGAGRLEDITWWNGAGNEKLSQHDYTLDALGRRTAVQREGGDNWDYSYNLRGEVEAATKSASSGQPEPGKKFGYSYDNLGNRDGIRGSRVSGLTDASTEHRSGYSSNALNQYTAKTNPGRLLQRGRAAPEASVLVDGHAPTVCEASGTWHDEVTINNTSGPVRRSVQIQAKRSAASVTGTDLIMNQTGSRFILPANEVLAHDADGNLTSDGHWTYSWDAENRLIAMEEKTSTRQPPGLMVRQRLEFRYDAGGRRIAKKVLHAEGNGNFVLKSSQVFLYDGWNMIGEFSIQNSSFILQRSYEWGPDVSGSFTGAGGVGGLILIKQPSTTVNNSQPSSTVYAPLYDGNGNITELCALSTQTITARYEYSAFGETITADGSAIADTNPFRFSTKYEDRETGLYYYGYRYYVPETGRWLSRDPIGEEGGVNLYGMVGNDAVNSLDVLGLESMPVDASEGSALQINYNSNVNYTLQSGLELRPGTLTGATSALLKTYTLQDSFLTNAVARKTGKLALIVNGGGEKGDEWEITFDVVVKIVSYNGAKVSFFVEADAGASIVEDGINSTMNSQLKGKKLTVVVPCKKDISSVTTTGGGAGGSISPTTNVEPPKSGDPKPKAPKPKGKGKGK